MQRIPVKDGDHRAPVIMMGPRSAECEIASNASVKPHFPLLKRLSVSSPHLSTNQEGKRDQTMIVDRLGRGSIGHFFSLSVWLLVGERVHKGNKMLHPEVEIPATFRDPQQHPRRDRTSSQPWLLGARCLEKRARLRGKRMVASTSGRDFRLGLWRNI